MIIKSLRLQNIRSYRDSTVELQQGRTLFEGDIGSGKSTLLMALEFALFGLGSETGAALLRSGEQRGSVALAFEVDGTQYSVRRNLIRKAGKVQQTDGELVTPDGAEDLSPKDMKEKMLKLLGFEEPVNPKAQSVIFRYAVYTPQEKMKEILSMDADLRLQTMRKAFGIEDYKIAKENALQLSGTMEGRAREFERLVNTQPSPATLSAGISKAKIDMETKKKQVAEASQLRDRKEKLRKSLVDDMATLKEDEHILRVATQKRSQLESFVRTNSSVMSMLADETRNLEKKVARVRAEVQTIEDMPDPTPKSRAQIAKDVDEIENHIREILRAKGRVEDKIEEYRSIRKTGSCPTCDREADPEEFVEKEKEKVAENDRYARTLQEHESALKETRELLEKKRAFEESRQHLQRYKEELSEAESDLTEKRNAERRMRGEHEELEDKLFKARKEIEMLVGVSERIDKVESEISSLEEELRRLRSTVDRAETDIEHIQKNLTEDERQLKTKLEAKDRASVLREHCIWLEDYFVPSLDTIEKQVLTSINLDFNSHFRDWFSTLVDDQSKEARVDENFTPLVEQDGYEQDVDYLSGGERTSVALAYRLALNGIVRRVSRGMRSNLLILDEPTDGFSNEQLGKMREILDEIDSPQVIIVSHDRELESFADQIYRVVKERGESRVLVSDPATVG